MAARPLAAWRFHPNGTEGFAKAEVTIGGINMEAGSGYVPGFYAISEAVDVTG